jgi:hypothetical protein
MKHFVIHYKKLLDRKKSIIEQFHKNKIKDYEFVQIDRDELDNQNTEIFHKEYSKPMIAVTLSHFYAYHKISENNNSALIFEDDVILSDNFTEKLDCYLKQLPNNFDMLFLGDGCNLHIPELLPDINIYEKQHHETSWGGMGASRCSDSYLISNKCAKSLVNYIRELSYKINTPIDWWLNNAIRDNNFNVYWAEPTIATQGSANGKFGSSY